MEFGLHFEQYKTADEWQCIRHRVAMTLFSACGSCHRHLVRLARVTATFRLYKHIAVGVFLSVVVCRTAPSESNYKLCKIPWHQNFSVFCRSLNFLFTSCIRTTWRRGFCVLANDGTLFPSRGHVHRRRD